MFGPADCFRFVDSALCGAIMSSSPSPRHNLRMIIFLATSASLGARSEVLGLGVEIVAHILGDLREAHAVHGG